MTDEQRPGTRFTDAEMKAMRRAVRDEDGVLSAFWDKIRELGRKLPFAESIVAAAYCAGDPATPARVKMLIVGALAYFVMPFDGIPDLLPMLGFSDDAAVIAATIAAVRLHLKETHFARAREFLGKRDAA
ncbi:MAG: YkvA family protein [Beijerinckiaceae bacterium]